MSAALRTRFRTIQQRYAEASGGARTASAPAARSESQRPPQPPARQAAAKSPEAFAGTGRTCLPLPALQRPAGPALLSAKAGSGLRARPAKPSPAPQVSTPELHSPALNINLLALYGQETASSFGLMAAAGFGAHWGGWIAARSNFTAAGGSYDCTGDGRTQQGRFWGNGQSRYGILSIAGGPLWKPLPWLGIYAGPGFTREELDWQDAEGNWARVRDYSYAGLSADAGLLLQWRHLALLAGCSWCGFATLTAGIGVNF